MRRSEAGFTLVELLVTTVILGVIAFGLTEAVILGLKTTNGTADRVGGTSALETLNSYFYGDVQSADQVSTTITSATDSTCTVPLTATVLLHLSWTDVDTVPPGSTDVFYVFETSAAGGQDLERITCTTGTSGADTRILGHFSGTTTPVTFLCGATTGSPAACSNASAVTLQVQTDPAAPMTDLTAIRLVSA